MLLSYWCYKVANKWEIFKVRNDLTEHELPCPPGKLGGQDSFESIESYESCERLTQSWSSQSSFSSLQRVPSYDSFDSEDYPAALHGHKPKGTFKDYVRERSDLSKDKPVIPAAALAGYTGKQFMIFFYYRNLKKDLGYFLLCVCVDAQESQNLFRPFHFFHILVGGYSCYN